MGESAESKTIDQKPVKHDWTFFFFIALTSLLIAAAIAWVSARSGMFANHDSQDRIESAVGNQSSP